MRLRRRIIFDKINNDMQGKPRVKDFMYIGGYDVTYVKFKTLQILDIVKTD